MRGAPDAAKTLLRRSGESRTDLQPHDCALASVQICTVYFGSSVMCHLTVTWPVFVVRILPPTWMFTSGAAFAYAAVIARTAAFNRSAFTSSPGFSAVAAANVASGILEFPSKFWDAKNRGGFFSAG
jgi:hypothetical protein